MSRGIVMETGSKHVIVLMPDGQFRKVRTALKPAIGEEIAFPEQRRMQRPRKLYSFSIGAAAIMLFLIAPFMAQRFAQPSSVVAYLTMDVNPSIELGIDKNERVEELHPINDDGKDVTKGLSYKGQPLEKVTEAIMDRISAGPYLNSGEGDVVITSVAVDDAVKPAEEISLTSHMDDAVRKSLSKTDKGRTLAVDVTTLSAPKEVREEAKKAGISSGKMAFYLMANDQGHRISIRELKKESIHQAAKPMGGVAAVMDDEKDNAKDKASSGPSSGTTPTQTVKPQAPQTPPVSKEKDDEALREKQKKQLEGLVKKEQEKHANGKGQDKKNPGEIAKGGKKEHGNNGKKPDDKNGAGSDRPGQQGGIINISEHSPGNNQGEANGVQAGGNVKGAGSGSSGSHSGSSGNGNSQGQGNWSGKNGSGSQGKGNGNGNGKSGAKDDKGKQNDRGNQDDNNSRPSSASKTSSWQQSGSRFGDSGSQGSGKGSDQHSEGGKDEAKNASDSRHSGVNQGSDKHDATREDSDRDTGRDKQDDQDSGKDSSKSSGSSKDNDSDKGKSKHGEEKD